VSPRLALLRIPLRADGNPLSLNVLQGGSPARARTARKIVDGGIAVMGHVGLTPQAISVIGGFRAQGRTAARAREIVDDALRLQDAGVFCVVLECVPPSVATAITGALEIPTIGKIGSFIIQNLPLFLKDDDQTGGIHTVTYLNPHQYRYRRWRRNFRPGTSLPRHDWHVQSSSPRALRPEVLQAIRSSWTYYSGGAAPIQAGSGIW